MHPLSLRAVRHRLRCWPWTAVVLLAVTGCFKKPIEPVAPTWDVDLTVPVTRKSYNLGELAEKEPSLFVSTPGSGDMVFRTSGSAEPSALGDLLGLRPQVVTGSASLGPIAIAPFLLGAPVQVPGLLAGVPVPPFSSLSLPGLPLTTAGFQSVTLEEGTLELRLQNNLPADIVIESPVILRDSAGAPACSFTFLPNVIPAGESRSALAPLAGVTLTARCSITDVLLSSSGSSTPVGGGEHLRATLTGTGLQADRAVLAAIPPQTLIQHSPVLFQMTDSTRVAHMRVGSGMMTLDATSSVSVPVLVRFRFDDLHGASGQPYTDSVALEAFGSGTRTIPMAGMSLQSPDGSLLTHLRVVSTVVLPHGSGGNAATLSRDDGFTYRLRTTAVVLDSMVGVLKPTAVMIDRDLALDWGGLEGNFKASMVLPSASLLFTPESSPGVPLLMNLRLEAPRPDGAGIATLPFPSDAYKTDGGPVVFDEAQVGAFLAQIVGDLPPTVRLAGSLVLNPYYDTSRRVSVGRATAVGGAIDLSVPLTLSVRGGSVLDTVVIGDTTSDGTIDRWLDGKTLASLNAGEITIDLENALPVAFTLKFSLLDVAGRPLLDLPQAAPDSIRVGPAELLDGSVVTPSRSRAILTLTAEEVRQLNPSHSLRFAVNLRTPGPGHVTFRASDRLTVRSWGRFSYTVDQ